MRIAESSLEEIRQRIDIVELVREYVPALKQSGRNHKACCPFHQERTPSFMVNPDKQIYHCFGCQAGGDVFSFLMKMEGLSFPEAAQKLGERAGVRVAQPEAELGPQERERLRLKGALEFAREYYREQLLKSPEAEPARGYLSKRGLSPKAGERFGLGYAPRGGQFLQAAGRKGYAPELLAKAGLAALREGRYRDYFWGRILYPIANVKGEVVGFGARAMGDAEPKYLNSPDTALFSKGRVLYGLYEGLGRLRKERKALVLEGYMDVIALQQFGFEHACAPLGTALTEDHAALLKRYADDVTLVFDPDAAGAAASLRGAEILLEKGLTVRIATVPDDLDPDELLHARGVRALEDCLASAQDLAAFRTDVALQGRKGPLSLEEKARVAAGILETVRKCPDEIVKSEWIRRLSQRLELDEAALHLQLRKAGLAAVPRRVRPPADAGKPPARPPAEEEELLLCLLRRPALAQDEALVSEGDFSAAPSRAVFSALREGRPEALGAEDAAFLRGLEMDPREVKDPEAVLRGLVRRIRGRRRLHELEPVVRRMGGEIPLDKNLYEEYKRLREELQGTQR